MADLKFQVYRGSAGPDHVDFRKSTGGFRGSPDDEHRTIHEVRIPDDAIDAALAKALVVNQALDKLDDLIPGVAGELASLLGLKGNGPPRLAVRLYDND